VLPLLGSTWTIPPGTEFIGNNLTTRDFPSYETGVKESNTTYVDFRSRLRTGLLTQFQYYVQVDDPITFGDVYVRFQVWRVVSTSYVGGTPTNYTVALEYEQRELLGRNPGVYTVRYFKFYFYLAVKI